LKSQDFQKKVNELKIVNQYEQLLVDSREVAEMVGKRHDYLI
jgi:phage regulator Rha-like protein